MDTNSWMNLAYLVLLGGALGGWVIYQNRGRMNQMMQGAVAWGLIFIGVVAAIGLWGDIRQSVAPRQAVLQGGEITVPQSPDGHYYLTAEVNGEPLRFMVDTGASDIVLTRADAARVGITEDDIVFSGRALSANGEVRIAPVRLDSVALGPVVAQGVRAMVNDGEMRQSLMGMSYLQTFSKIEIGDGALLLKP
ncbi:aspartyl protease [Pseudooceanicola atlanticus]|uniref:Aspartyl protease n=2 Tax=Pseudooceanicola atlanticus TaxID=1461694 RepID=A0A0A0EEE1_9RHOB|nr:TIGR02281 family clan AA aspartic protease [Pseudooceanicola atlanticus]KGM48680.1 aspartyl protease [Pseudooceanicola atlanticus]